MKSLTIGKREIGDGLPMLLIAEVASAHEGSFDNLLVLIDIASRAGAESIKFQVFNTASHMTPSHEIFELAKKLELSSAEWMKAIKYTRDNTDMIVLADIYDEASVSVVDAMDVDIVKIHSADLGNYPLIRNVAKLGKPTLFGIGASEHDEIQLALDEFLAVDPHQFIGLLYGYQGFPTNIEEMHIRRLATLRDRYQLPVGYLDHVEGGTSESLYIPLLAQALGAFAIEKHLTIDREDKGTDYESALTEAPLKELVEMIKLSELALGKSPHLPLSEAEIRYRRFMKKTIVAGQNLEAGDELSEGAITLKRSSPGIGAEEYYDVIGRKVVSSVKQDESITWGNIDE